jgi:hypothetical protein
VGDNVTSVANTFATGSVSGSVGWNFTSIWYLPTGKFPMLQALESTQ